MYGVVLDAATGMNAETFAKRLAEGGVQTRPFFLGMHAQPVLRGQGLFDGEDYPVADQIARQGLYLPSGLTLTPEQLDRVCDVVESVVKSSKQISS